VQLGGADVFLLLGMVEEQPSCKCSTLCTVSTLYSVLPLYPCAQARTRVALLSDEWKNPHPAHCFLAHPKQPNLVNLPLTACFVGLLQCRMDLRS